MTDDNELKRTPDEQRSQPDPDAQPSQPQGESEEHPARGAQAQRDEEIDEIQKRSRHQPPTVQKPPEVPPASPRKALTIV